MSDRNFVTFLTGASSGIGRRLAQLLAADGESIALVARRAEELTRLAEEIQSKGGKALPIACDVSDKTQVHNAVRQCEQEFGPVDRLIANAGISEPTPVDHFDSAVADKIFRINLFGAVYCIEAVLTGMMQRKRGHIVGMSSLAGFRGLPGSAAYCASKAALISFLESFRIELRNYNVDVSIICPGFVKTAMTAKNQNPMPFLMELEDAARSIHKAIKRRKRMHTLPWQLAAIVKAARLIPDSLYDWSFSQTGLKLK